MFNCIRVLPQTCLFFMEEMKPQAYHFWREKFAFNVGRIESKPANREDAYDFFALKKKKKANQWLYFMLESAWYIKKKMCFFFIINLLLIFHWKKKWKENLDILTLPPFPLPPTSAGCLGRVTCISDCERRGAWLSVHWVHQRHEGFRKVDSNFDSAISVTFS